MLKKYHFAILCFSMALFCSAQPTLSAADIPANFTSVLYNTTSGNFLVGNSGPNQTWNYSNIWLPPIGLFNAVPVSNGTFTTTFPQANICYNFDPDAPNQNYYYYLKSSATGIEQLGFVSNEAIIKNFNINPKKIIQFPYTFNTVFTDTYQSTSESAPTSVTVTYDAYGTLILPFGTFQNVIRQKIVENGITNYKWINTNPFYYILETYFESNTISITKNTTVLNVTENNKSAHFLLTPNPVFAKLSISKVDYELNDLVIIVYNNLGQIVKKQIVNSIDYQTPIEIDFEDLTSGLYITKFLNINNKELATYKIIKKEK